MCGSTPVRFQLINSLHVENFVVCIVVKLAQDIHRDGVNYCGVIPIWLVGLPILCTDLISKNL